MELDTSTAGGEWHSLEVPKYVGCYVIGNHLRFSFPKKPKLIHRLFTKLLLGWEWEDFE